jgi:hypothetical protein
MRTLLSVMKSRVVHRHTKIRLHKTLIRSVLWTLSQTARKILNAFERKVLRKIYAPVLVNGRWRNRYNDDMYSLYKQLELTRNIRLRRLQWVGHVLRMKDEREPK